MCMCMCMCMRMCVCMCTWHGTVLYAPTPPVSRCCARRGARLVQGEHEKALRRAVTKAEAASARERDALTRAAAREKAALLRYAERADGQVRP